VVPVQATGLLQVPWVVQVSTPFPAQAVWPGTQVPEQTPLAQTNGHSVPGCQLPPSSQYSASLPASPPHSVESGTQEPTQLPLAQA
jgi:hypothetical protein